MGKLGKPVTQRQLRVGEMIKQALSMIFLKDDIFTALCSAIFFASLLGFTLKAINTAFDALANVTSVSVTIPISAKIILGLT